MRWMFFAFILGGCMSSAKENELRQDIFKLQTRVLQLEQRTEGQPAKLENSKKNIGAVQTSVERVKRDMRKLKGEVDTLRVAVKTGEIPGEETEEDTVASRIAGLQSRIENIEQAQIEILDLMEGKKSSKKSKSVKITSLTSMRKAFKQRRYLHVADAAENLLKKFSKKSSKEEGLFLYSESLYKLGRLREAAIKYDDFIQAYASSKSVPHAKLRLGDCFRHLGDTDTAKLYYEELVSKYAKTEEAKTAQERLDRFSKQG